MKTITMMILVCAIGCASDAPRESTDAQDLLACDDFGCSDSAVSLALGGIYHRFGHVASSSACDIDSTPLDGGAPIAICDHDHADGGGEQCWVRFSGPQVVGQGCTSWGPGE
jgi:hypothetical protein